MAGFGGAKFGFDSFANYGSTEISDSDLPYGRVIQDPAAAVDENLKKFTANLTKLKTLVPLVGTNKDNHELRDQIGKLSKETNSLAIATRNLLQSGFRAEGAGDRADVKKKLNKLMKDFQTNLSTFEEITQNYKQREIKFALPPRPPK
eukprot:TRINITY_DN3693_c0_g1_i1.p1 TRINITY_DN3693_c0_g1~~TRINITY_DN3693_c0_g1_i1.p1  ORF type:complete len:148 (-),score=42.40 TRINITY_DN3693_c0_g1_i1:332-775(-)